MSMVHVNTIDRWIGSSVHVDCLSYLAHNIAISISEKSAGSTAGV